MICPQCNCAEQRVLETRVHRDHEIRRRRECTQCKFRFTTVETILVHYPHVVKKDGRREPFSREKLRRGIQIACKKRPVSMSQIEALVARISKWVENSPEKEMNAHKIGQVVIQGLKDLDDVAYVRFASVYKTFTDVSEFLKSLESERNSTDPQPP